MGHHSVPKSRREGWLLVDNRLSGGAIIEAATATCSHCQRQVIRNPARLRERAWCARCDAYICDACAAAGACRPFNRLIEKEIKRHG